MQMKTSYDRFLTEEGKHLAFLLRHDKQAFDNGLIDSNGWRQCDELCREQGFLYETLVDIVETNNKQRYEFNDIFTKIRARQGHSIPVDVDLNEVEGGLETLFHGTDVRFIDSIKNEGIRKMTRNHVHLSPNINIAKNVGKRHGNNIRIIEIDAKKMLEDGIKIFVSRNNVYLTEYVDPKYFNKIIEH